MTPGVFIKICGITRLTDALHATQHGATALGFVFWPKSPRYLAPARAAEIIGELPSHVLTIGVFVNETVDGIRDVVARTGITSVQLHGDEPPAYRAALSWPVLRSVTVSDAASVVSAWRDDTLLLLDAADPVRRGGTGGLVDWQHAAQVAQRRRVVLAGGLTPDNVGEAIATVRPYGVDVSSGVEQSPGVKDLDKVARFVANARSAFEDQQNHGSSA
jgi:phosphoribosylanthranilate isomerase